MDCADADEQRRTKKPRIAELKPDNEKRPLWVCDDCTILLETSSEFCKQAYDFCIAIAEPESRLQSFHEYKITAASLYGAVSAGMAPDDVIKFLGLLSKTALPENVVKYIRKCTDNVGKLKFSLKNGSMVIQAEDPASIRAISRYPEIKNAIVHDSDMNSDRCLVVKHLEVMQVRQKCREINYPLQEEYDYRNDTSCKTLDIKLNPKAILRPYQKASVDKMFVNGKARSGVIVLPCGAGKSLTGVYAAVRLGKPVLCFANTSVSVEQWAFQFLQWTNLREHNVQMLTSETKSSEFKARADIMVTTYSMYGFSGHRSKDSEEIMRVLMTREWGLILMDEVHVVPAKNFRDAVAKTRAHCKLGLTATLLREDDFINDLEFIIGPKLYEANWQDLVQAGYLATVDCFEILCPMTKDFLREYLKVFMPADGAYYGRGRYYGHGNEAGGGGAAAAEQQQQERDKQRKSVQHTLCSVNPNKLMACEFLIKYHESRGDKIIVFSDNLLALERMAIHLKKHMIRGNTSHEERLDVLRRFRSAQGGFTVFLSKVGDTSLDLPEATVVIQISSQGASRRQEAQRLGRVLRPKMKSAGGILSGGQALFYSLVSQDTSEMLYASKRQKFLVNQGYTFRTYTDFPDAKEKEKLVFAGHDIQRKLLDDALHYKEEAEREKQRAKEQQLQQQQQHLKRGLKKEQQQHKLFRARDKERKNLEKERRKVQQQQDREAQGF